jgi:hypothetical protein
LGVLDRSLERAFLDLIERIAYFDGLALLEDDFF